MRVTDVQVTLNQSGNRLLAFCKLVVGDFVIHDVKVIDGVHGIFVAMPQKEKCDECPRCGKRNGLSVEYCPRCGKPRERKWHALERNEIWLDLVHPINQAMRDEVTRAVLDEYHRELERTRTKACA